MARLRALAGLLLTAFSVTMFAVEIASLRSEMWVEVTHNGSARIVFNTPVINIGLFEGRSVAYVVSQVPKFTIAAVFTTADYFNFYSETVAQFGALCVAEKTAFDAAASGLLYTALLVIALLIFVFAGFVFALLGWTSHGPRFSLLCAGICFALSASAAVAALVVFASNVFSISGRHTCPPTAAVPFLDVTMKYGWAWGMTILSAILSTANVVLLVLGGRGQRAEPLLAKPSNPTLSAPLGKFPDSV